MNTHITSSENTYFFENDSKLKINAGWYSPMYNEHWTLTAGSQGMAQINTNHSEEILIPDAYTTDFGLFAVSNFHYSQKLNAMISASFKLTKAIEKISIYVQNKYSLILAVISM